MHPCICGLDTQIDSAKVIAESKQSSANEKHYFLFNPCCVTVERCPVNINTPKMSFVCSVVLKMIYQKHYRAEKKSWYVVARNFFLLLLNFSAWPCLGAA